MLRRYPVEAQRIRWKHVINDQWTCVVEGTAEVIGAFRFPHGAGVYVVVGQDNIRKFVENWASNKAILNLFGKD